MVEGTVKKKRKRTYGSFGCDFTGCTRVFKRQDHLVRHKRNHDPSIRYECTWPGCHRSFARNDIKEKHYRRHLVNSDLADKDLGRNDLEDGPTSQFPVSVRPSNQYSPYSEAIIAESSFSPGLANEPAGQFPGLSPGTPSAFPSMPAKRYKSINMNTKERYSGPGDTDHDRNKNISPSDLINWLYQDDSAANDAQIMDPTFPLKSYWDIYSEVSPMSLLDTMFAISPDFPNSGSRKTITSGLRQEFISLIPSLAMSADFGVHQIERYLEIYWQLFHPQYPVLHKPSFTNYDAHPLLLLSMIMVAASMASCTGRQEPFTAPRELAEEIAEPIRWLIFAHRDCKPPAKTWVVQSLLILDTYEITNSTRPLHERAFLHHGTKIQLLRRSPFLAGDPLKDDNDHEVHHSPKGVWQKWINAESMKRATLMAFYLDAVNATVYGHMIVLFSHQIKISLPCDDQLWEFDDTEEKRNVLQNDRPPKFLATLRNLLHRQKFKANAFSKKILLAGLLTIIFQMQQKDLQMSILEWDQVQKFWTEAISLSLDVWKLDVLCEDWCEIPKAVTSEEAENVSSPLQHWMDDSRCKYDIYHVAQVYMRISHFDYMIFAGSPRRMNVSTKTSEYSIVEQRVHKWAQSEEGRIAVIHAYFFLFEMFLSPKNETEIFTYDPNVDPFLHRKNIMATMILVVFAYNFSLFGAESNVFESSLYQGEIHPAKEDGYDYLKRIRREITMYVGKIHLPQNASSSTELHENVKQCAQALETIENTNHMVGLLTILHNTYRTSEWEIGKEYAKLFKNCIERLWGRKKITCDDMFMDSSQ